MNCEAPAITVWAIGMEETEIVVVAALIVIMESEMAEAGAGVIVFPVTWPFTVLKSLDGVVEA